MDAAALGIVQRVDGARLAGGDVVLVRARAPGATSHLLVAASQRGVRAALVEGDAATIARAAMRAERHPQEGVWRARLEGARVVGVGTRGVAFERDGARVVLVRDGARLALEEVEPGTSTETAPTAGDALADLGAALVAELAGAAVADRRNALAKAIARAVTKIERRADAVRADLARIGEAESVAARARLFVAEAARVPRGARGMSIVDWSSGEAQTLEMPLDPARSAREALDAIFRRAKRLKDGARFGSARLAEAESAAEKLRAVAAEVDAATDLPALDALATRARAAAPRDFRDGPGATGASTKRAQAPLPPYRTFRGARGARILVGRGAVHNDALTFHVAKPHDLWLHAKGRAGAHVIVPLEKGASCAPDLLADAAHLAAQFSEAKDELAVEIQYTPRRYLRKPRGSAPGLVVVDREKVLVLRREEARLRALLATEET